MWDIRKHTLFICQTYFIPIPKDSDTSFRTWIDGTNYTQKEKEGFEQLLKERDTLEEKDYKNKCFIKAETYPEFKHFRPIKSRSDRFKAKMGPIFQLINEVLFTQKEFFIKKVPVRDRPKVIKEILEGYLEMNLTDFSSFEAHFLPMVMFCIEYVFYEYCVQFLDEGPWFMSEIDKSMMKLNKCEFKSFVAYCLSRCSGEMCTSSGNGLSNLVITTYTSRSKSCVRFSGQFEGDDGVTGTLPVESSPTTKDFEELGWSCKLETTLDFSKASFCGIVADEDDLLTVCDVRQYLVDFAWTSPRYVKANFSTRLSLLRAKGYSAIYQYPGCPIIQALGYYALRVTNIDFVDKKMRRMIEKGGIARNRYKKEELLRAIAHKIPEPMLIPTNTRMLVDQLYGVTPEQQMDIERVLEHKNDLEPLEIELNYPKDWITNWNLYVSDRNLETRDLSWYKDNLDLVRQLLPTADLNGFR